MNVDPTTPEGMAEIKRRAQKAKAYAKKMRELAEQCPNDQPSGKLTQPNELDLRRDRRGED
jgi:hypothetical protein